jgi:hypothetical protein
MFFQQDSLNSKTHQYLSLMEGSRSSNLFYFQLRTYLTPYKAILTDLLLLRIILSLQQIGRPLTCGLISLETPQIVPQCQINARQPLVTPMVHLLMLTLAFAPWNTQSSLWRRELLGMVFARQTYQISFGLFLDAFLIFDFLVQLHTEKKNSIDYFKCMSLKHIYPLGASLHYLTPRGIRIFYCDYIVTKKFNNIK